MYNALLKTFITAADCGSMNRAAQNLYLTPTAVMKQLDLLEKHLGLKLFVRSNHGLCLTECGQSVYKDAKYMIRYSQQALARAREIAGRQCCVIRVGTSMLNPCKAFMDIWYRLSDYFPQFKIQIIPFEDDHNGILSVIGKIGRELDFIVGVCNSQQWLDRCRMYPLGSYRKCVAVPVGHRLAGKRKLSIQDLYGETLMMVKRGDSPLNDALRDDLEQNHPEIHIENTSHFYDIEVFNRCEQQGNVLLNLECWKDVHPSLVTLPVEWEYSIPYGLLYSLSAGPEILKFVEAVQGFAEKEKQPLQP